MVRIGSKNPPPRISTRPASTSVSQSGDVVRMLVDQPFQERPRGVQDERDFRIALEHVQKRQIAGAISLLEDAVEVAHGLMVMKREDQANVRHGRPLDRSAKTAAADRGGSPIGAGDLDLTQEASRVLGGNRVDVKARAPLETGDLGQTRNDLDVPMVMRQLAMVKRSGVNDVVVRRAVERQLELVQNSGGAQVPGRRRPAWGCSRSGWSGSWARSRSRREIGWRTDRTP